MERMIYVLYQHRRTATDQGLLLKGPEKIGLEDPEDPDQRR